MLVALLTWPATSPWLPVGSARASSVPRFALSVPRALPIGFEPNRGQGPAGDLFLARAPGIDLALSRTGIALGSALRLGFAGANTASRPIPSGRLPGVVSYLIGDVPARWRVNIPTYRRLTYHGLYPGIDLTFSGTRATLEATWRLAPHADLGRIRLTVSGASRLRRGHDGSVSALASGLPFTLGAPHAYQWRGGVRRAVPIRFLLGPTGRIGLRGGSYDRTRPLVVDPTLAYGTNLGGSNSDFGGGITVDGRGDTFVTGSTASPDFPVVRAVQPREPGSTDQEDAFVSELNPAGDALLFSTYLGGNNDESGVGIALGAGGAIYVSGFTRSANFPQLHPLPEQSGGCNHHDSSGDAFVLKLAPGGARLLYSTCLGGSGTDWSTGIAVDRRGSAYITGGTGSGDFPTVHAYQRHRPGGVDAYVARLAPGGAHLVYSTYLGGSGADQASSIALDRSGSAYVVGTTNSRNFPRHAPLQADLAGGTDAFVARLTPDGRHLLFAGYLGGAADDTGLGVAVDGTGAIYVAGSTSSADFPTSHAYQPHTGGAVDAFVTKYAPGGSQLLFSTYLGGSGNDAATALAVDPRGAIYLTGSTASPNFPRERPLQPEYAGGYFYGDAFAAALQGDGQSLLYSTYLGGKGDDVGTAIAVDRSGAAFISGGTSSTDFPITREVSGGRPSRGNAFVVCIRE